MQRSERWFLVLGLFPTCVFASSAFVHADPIASVILWVTLIFFFAIVGRYLARLLHQPGVLGELFMGVLVGNLCYFLGSHLVILLREGAPIFDVVKAMLRGVPLKQAVHHAIPNLYYSKEVIAALSGPKGAEYLKIAYIMDIFSRYGVMFLLFMVGLEHSVDELKRTGRASLFVAVIGVAAPVILGFGVARLVLSSSSYHVDLFIAAALSATSIGITAGVLREMNQLGTREAQIILGAATIDDLLGLVLLAVVSSVVLNGSVHCSMIIRIIVSSLLFFAGVLWIGPMALRWALRFFRFLKPWESKLFISFLFIMVLSWLAASIQLASIIGAFAAGVLLHDHYFNSDAQEQERSIEHLISPLESILAPMFFMMVGMQVKLELFCHWEVVLFAAALLCAAVLGKLLSGFGAGAKDDRLLIGIGMLPRGEVGLVFASIGRTLGVISDDLFSAIVLMVLVTTFVTPPLLKARFIRKKG